MIKGGNFYWKLQTPNKFSKWSEGVIYYFKLQTPEKLILNMTMRGVGVGGLNNLIHWSEKDLSTWFLPLICDVKASSSILATLTSLEQ